MDPDVNAVASRQRRGARAGCRRGRNFGVVVDKGLVSTGLFALVALEMVVSVYGDWLRK